MSEPSPTMTDKSPFARPAVMHGYPLDRTEEAAVTRALQEVERPRTNGSSPSSHEQPERPLPAEASDS